MTAVPAVGVYRPEENSSSESVLNIFHFKVQCTKDSCIGEGRSGVMEKGV